MRILSYNILDGGTGRNSALHSVIQKQKPDVVGLVEAEDRSLVENLAGRLGMDFVHAPGRRKASALLCRFVIRDSINHGPLHGELTKSLLEATVIDDKGGSWILGVLHLHAHALEADEKVREREIGKILEVFAHHRAAGRRHLLMGDFNANSPDQVIDPDQCKKATREAWQKNGGQIPRRAIRQVLDGGYLDTLAVVDRQRANTIGTFSTEHPGQRVDYIFSCGVEPKRIKGADIIYDDPASEASDHFPIVAEIQ